MTLDNFTADLCRPFTADLTPPPYSKELDPHYEIVRLENKLWYAYFKPHDWQRFGQSCEIDAHGQSVTYKSFDDARRACWRHLDIFGQRPGKFDQIRK